MFDRTENFLLNDDGKALITLRHRGIHDKVIHVHIQKKPILCRGVFDLEPLPANESSEFVMDGEAQLLFRVAELKDQSRPLRAFYLLPMVQLEIGNVKVRLSHADELI